MCMKILFLAQWAKRQRPYERAISVRSRYFCGIRSCNGNKLLQQNNSLFYGSENVRCKLCTVLKALKAGRLGEQNKFGCCEITHFTILTLGKWDYTTWVFTGFASSVKQDLRNVRFRSYAENRNLYGYSLIICEILIICRSHMLKFNIMQSCVASYFGPAYKFWKNSNQIANTWF